MPLLRLAAVTALLLASHGLFFRPAAAGERLLTAKEARAKVQTWDRVPDEEIVKSSAKHLGGRLYYRFELRNGDGYQVDSTNGRVSVVYASRLTVGSRAKVEARMLPLKRLQHFAEATRRRRFPEGAAMTLMLRSEPHFDGSGYCFSFGQVLPENGAWTDNGCSITVRADTGEITAYSDHLEAVPAYARIRPPITATRAREVAQRAAGYVEAKLSRPSRLSYSRGKFRWVVRLEGKDAAGLRGSCLVHVDARTGKADEPLQYASPNIE